MMKKRKTVRPVADAYKFKRNKRFYDLKTSGLTYTEIALNENYNPERLTPQRIHQVVRYYESYIKDLRDAP